SAFLVQAIPQYSGDLFLIPDFAYSNSLVELSTARSCEPILHQFWQWQQAVRPLFAAVPAVLPAVPAREFQAPGLIGLKAPLRKIENPHQIPASKKLRLFQQSNFADAGDPLAVTSAVHQL